MSSKKRNRVFFIVLISILSIVYFTYREMYKPHKTIESQEVFYKGTATSLLKQVAESPEKWNNKIVEIEGKVTSSDTIGLMLNSSIYCQRNNAFKTVLMTGKTHTFKGRVIGYDDLLEEIKLDKVILKK